MHEPDPAPRPTTVEGRSDDLVIIRHLSRGKSVEIARQNTTEVAPVRLRFSDGTELDVFYDAVGIWRAKVRAVGLAHPRVEELPADGLVPPDRYSEIVTFSSAIRDVEVWHLDRFVRVG